MSKKFPVPLHRISLFPGYFFCFVPSAEALKRISNWASCALKYPPAGVGRHLSITQDNQTISMIMLGPVDDRHTELAVLSGFVHECSHAVDELFEHIGERNPSPELRCYALQYIFETLFPAVKEAHRVHALD